MHLKRREDEALRSGTYALDFVKVLEDGSVREPAPDEIEYLNTPFLPGDSGRPYIKEHYDALTPDGRIGGFIHRRFVPRRLIVSETKKEPNQSLQRNADAAPSADEALPPRG
jgi:hypothetical protein